MKPEYPYKKKSDNRPLLGLGLLGLGIFLLLNQFDVLPDFIRYRHMLPFGLIIVGLYLGFKNNFTTLAPYIFIGIGAANLIGNFEIGNTGVTARQILFPASIAILGAYFLLKGSKPTQYTIDTPPAPQNKKNSSESVEERWKIVSNTPTTEASGSLSGTSIDIKSIFSGRKESINLRDFSGGNSTTVFGGTELNFINCKTSKPTVILNTTVAFGGLEIIVPAHWIIKNETTALIGSVSDERVANALHHEGDVTLVLRGLCTFGGIEVKSF